jgi:hypothetical protein
MTLHHLERRAASVEARREKKMKFATSRRLGHALKVSLLALFVGAALFSTAGGCAIHSQAPIKEVAYDFSDADFYDRDYAPSPNYASGYKEYDLVIPTTDPNVVDVILVREPE